MSNIIDYIEWRGDLDFRKTPFNRIDALILSQLSYLNFDGLLPESDFSVRIDFSELAEKFMNSKDFKKRSDTGMLINKITVPFFQSVAKSNRYKNVKVTGYSSKIDNSIEEQFSAMTFILSDNTSFIAFRGTDDTIVGWKEDFNLALEDEVPSQKDAVEYLEKAAAEIPGKLRIGGHSKGGNLAIYSSAMVASEVSDRISKIYNYDGPGFYENRINSPEFLKITSKVYSYYPQFSIVGMLFHHVGIQHFVESDEQGLMQHDPFSWHVQSLDFVNVEKADYGSRFFHDTFNVWISNIEAERREKFITTVFDIIASTDATTNSEIESNIARNSVKIIRAYNKLDPDMKKMCENTVIELFKAGHSQIYKIDGMILKKIKNAGKKTKMVLKENFINRLENKLKSLTMYLSRIIIKR